MRELKQDEWNRLVTEGLSDDGQSNTRFPFSTMSKKFGLAWLEYCKVAWQANEGCMSEDEFCKINGEIPRKFFETKIKST